MKFATYRDGSRDGQLVLVSRDLARAVVVPDIATTLQSALDHWADAEPALRRRAAQLDEGALAGAFPFEPAMCMAPLPRAYQWADGSAYLHHVELVRRARGAQMPPEFLHDPLMYQGGSDSFLGPRDDIVCADEAWGIDFEAEIAVVTGDLPVGASPVRALAAVRLVLLVNDVSLRNLIPAELAKGFGFLQSKPSSAFAPVAVTPDELGAAWQGGRLDLQLRVDRNGQPFGRLRTGEGMQFSFGELIAHLCRTRAASAGTIVGSGTVSNALPGAGHACIAERRMVEQIDSGAAATAFLRDAEVVRIEALDSQGATVFGAIEQRVTIQAAPA
jgi:fumarylacetoacetate (FAA) hydrolase